MQIKSLNIPEIKLITCKAIGDARGFFTERYRLDKFQEFGFEAPFIQENFSRSAHNILRGLHFQYDKPQGKLITCMSGKIFDVAVDIRANSKTFGQCATAVLEATKPEWLWIPPGFAHGFYVMSEQGADVFYKTDSYYNPKGEEGISWNDPELKIDWPSRTPTLSARDSQLLSLAQYKKNPRF